MTTAAYDIEVVNHYSLYLVHPLTQDGAEWIEEHVQDDAQWWNASLVVEPRYIADLVGGMVEDGLTVTTEKGRVLAPDEG